MSSDSRLISGQSRPLAGARGADDDLGLGYVLGTFRMPDEPRSHARLTDLEQADRNQLFAEVERLEAQVLDLRRQLAEREGNFTQAADAKRTLDAILACVPEGITVVSAPSGKTVLASQYGDELLFEGHNESTGLSLEDWLTRVEHFLSDGVTPARAEDLPLWKALHLGHTVVGQELVLRRPNGSRVFVSCNAAPIRSPDGSITGAVVAWRDISDLRRAQAQTVGTEKKLRASERIYQAIGESIDYGIWICAPDGRNIYASQSFLDLVGITQEECSNFGWGNVLHPDDAERTLSAWKECCEKLGNWDIEHRYRRPDGQWHPILARGVPVKNEQGELECWAGINLDISRLKSTEQQLRSQQARLELLSNTAARLLATEEPLVVVNDLCREVMTHLDCQAFFNFVMLPSGDRLHLNAWAGITERAARGIEFIELGSTVCGCVARDKWPSVLCDLEHSTDPQTAFIRSVGLRAYCCHPLMADGNAIGTLSFGTRTRARFTEDDVDLMRTVADHVATAMHRMLAVRALSEANSQLKEADRQKNEFLAVLSHELRNPLTPIRNSLYLLDHAVPGGRQAERAKQILDRQVSQLSRLVDDLLDVTRLTRGKLRLETSRIDLTSVVRAVADDYRSLFDGRGVNFQLKLESGETVWIDGDPARLAQAIGNLLSNAAKFTEPNASVTLSLERESHGWVAIRVRDTGVGMAREMLHRLFEPFAQADESLDRNRGGLGLGLSLVKGIVEMHGGTVAAHSDGPGAGAEFSIRLRAESHAPVDVPRRPLQNSHTPRHILVIEDNVDSAESLRDLLEHYGHRVELAFSGPDGVKLALESKPEFVICDIGLPGFDGFRVAKALCTDSRLASTRLIAMSGYARPEDLRLANDAGFHGHIAKPATLERLSEVLGMELPRLDY